MSWYEELRERQKDCKHTSTTENLALYTEYGECEVYSTCDNCEFYTRIVDIYDIDFELNRNQDFLKELIQLVKKYQMVESE